MASGYSKARAKACIRLLWLLAAVLVVTTIYIICNRMKHSSLLPSWNIATYTIGHSSAADGHSRHQHTEKVKLKNITTSVAALASSTPPSTQPERVTEVVQEHASAIQTTKASKRAETSTTAAAPIGANVTETFLMKHLVNYSAHDDANTTAKSAASWSKTNYSFGTNITKPMKAVLLKQFADTDPQQKRSKVERILEVAYFRSGSSFLGQLLSANPRTFYHFEPLRTLPVGPRLYGREALRGLDYITDFFGCDFAKHLDHLRLGIKYPHPFRQNTYLWSVCKGIKRVCLDPEFLNAVCKAAPMQVMKVVRIGMDTVRRYLLDGPMAAAEELRVVHLVRDPRAIWLSRQRRKWCRPRCASATMLCNDMKHDLDIFENISRGFPGRAIQVRLEDLALNTLNVTSEMYNALGLPLTTSVRQFIDSHTHETNVKVQRDAYATSRNSKDVVNAWKRQIRPEDALHINTACAHVIKRLGYEL
ncbi:carbohydrate sulfotransferase 6-like [Rhipicephalus sanguineus]|uniref:carbohydrate sulfotransferase 6-like n=1 Tax=Rhipicephalus sanguineus TaxID=34632 RepID=UPI0018952178|nr:carbohydrate sulfotransferase 6-like [Rhipicephalus sanguineus]